MKLVLLDQRDNVATATEDVEIGENVSAGDILVQARDRIPLGHKIALRAIGVGYDVIRYGEIIGEATLDIAPGEHVHVQNLVSKRLPG